MSYKIAIASGKGGTGKTTVAVNLFQHFSESTNTTTQLVDCDVEEPNDTIFFSELQKKGEKEIFQRIPEIDKSKCTFCRKCVEYCEFNAIVVIPPINFAEVNPSLCHSCGACLVACKDNAITEKDYSIGKVSFFKTNSASELVEGRLKIGSAMQTLLIKELKKHISEEKDVVLYDAPPGTSCPVVETISDVDYVVLVTEPTPFGLHDLKLMVELLEEVKKPYGVIINKSGIGDRKVYEFLKSKTIELLGEIPFKKEFASNYAYGNLFSNMPLEIKESFNEIFKNIKNKILVYEGDNDFKR
jgi:MinD superfamily P-loop ATPase